MAGVAATPAVEPVRAGVFSRLAREQYGALADMRWSMFRHGMRTTKGAVETVARVVVIVVYSCIGLRHGVGIWDRGLCGCRAWALESDADFSGGLVFYLADCAGIAGVVSGAV